MKLTTEKLKQIIKEEMEKMAEPEAPEVSQSVQRVRDQMKSGAQAAADRITRKDDIEQILQDTIDSITRAQNVPTQIMIAALRSLLFKMSSSNKK
tara:strand:- start:1782 stop:2066 length:285 start_codon:yes stop_codon:yes gene_type:complete